VAGALMRGRAHPGAVVRFRALAYTPGRVDPESVPTAFRGRKMSAARASVISRDVPPPGSPRPPARVGRPPGPAALLLLAGLAWAANAGAAEYYSRPLYHIGLPGTAWVSQVTAAGGLNNGSAEFSYATGVEMAPVDSVVIAPSPDGRPLLHGTLERDGFGYDFEYFSAPLVLGLARPPQVDVVQVRISNRRSQTRVAHFWAGAAPPDADGGASMVGQRFSYSWHYEFRGNVITREFRVLGAYPTGYNARYAYAGRSYTGMFPSVPRETQPQDPKMLARYELPLAPGGDTTLTFYYPAEPGPDSYAALLNSLRADTLRARFDALWDARLAGLPALQLGEPRLTQFVRGNLVLGLLQVSEAGGRWIFYANKNARPEAEPLDMARVLRLWHRLGLEGWVRGVLAGLRSIPREGGVMLSPRDGRAATAAWLGLESELALSPPGPPGGNGAPGPGGSADAAAPWPELAGGADSLAQWLSPAAPAQPTLLEASVGSWALARYAALRSGRPDGAARQQQASQALQFLEERLKSLPDTALLSPDARALGWLDLAGARPGAPARVLQAGPRWKDREGLVCTGDSAWIGRSMDRVEALSGGAEAGARDLLAVVAHSTVQGGLPATLNLARRSFDMELPPETVEGARAARDLLDRVACDSAGGLWLGRGLPAAAPGASVVVGPLLMPVGSVRVRAAYAPRRAAWSWTWPAAGAAAQVRVYGPPGARLVAGGGRMAPDSSYTEFPAAAGHGEIAWRPGGGSETLPELLDELSAARPAARARPVTPPKRPARRPGRR